jgi:hypothetical protein
MSIAVPLYGFGGSGGGSGGTLTVTAPANVTVTVSKDGKTKTKNSGTSGVVVFKGLASGTWTVTITGDDKTAKKSVVIITDYSTAISFSTIPEFTYTGDFEIVNDSDEPISVSQDNWKIRFLTSGTLIFTNLNGAEGGIDVFLVGGGAGGNYGYRGGAGGGSGYTRTTQAVTVRVGVQYDIVIGAGGAGAKTSGGRAGGVTSAFGSSANGGATLSDNGVYGGDGGSGGGSGTLNQDKDGAYSKAGIGGTDGANGQGTHPGTGQGTTTREFGEPSGTLYATGGKGAAANNITPDPVSQNTGDGGNGAGGSIESTAGGSGIAIIRNTRGAA